MFTQKSKPTCSTKELTAKLAQEIYTAIKENGTWQKAFTALDTDFDLTNCKAVDTLFQAVRSEIQTKMGGNFILTPMVPATYNEDMSEKTPAVPAVMFTPSTQKALADSLETILDAEVVVADVIAYNGSYDADRTWAQFKESFKTEV